MISFTEHKIEFKAQAVWSLLAGFYALCDCAFVDTGDCRRIFGKSLIS